MGRVGWVVVASLLVNLCVCAAGDAIPAELLLRVLQTETNDNLQHLAQISDAGPSVSARYFLTPAHRRAAEQLMTWMREAGMRAWLDDIGNVHGRVDSASNPDAPVTIFGSHYDTVYDGGKFDGALGIVAATAAVKASVLEAAIATGLLKDADLSAPTLDLSSLLGDKVNTLFDRPLEVVGFCDEEGVRFQSTFLGSSALAGTLLQGRAAHAEDAEGHSVLQVLEDAGFAGTEPSLQALAMQPQQVARYIELHIEQGPVLESLNRPLGVVRSIIGQSRLMVEVAGEQGHAGTVPMQLRRDPMAGAAEMVHAIEGICKGEGEVGVEESTVCTVGSLSVWPGVVNVIPGSVNFTVDIRSGDDALRTSVVAAVEAAVEEACARRGLQCVTRQTHSSPAVHCDEDTVQQLKGAVHAAELVGAALQQAAECSECDHVRIPPPAPLVPACEEDSCPAAADVPVLTSGAGHDALAMASLTRVGMVFVRCRGGVSHSPLEHVEESDVGVATAVLFAYIRAALVAATEQ